MTLTPISLRESARKKTFYELDVHHVQKVGIKRFWAQEIEMTLQPSVRANQREKKFF